MAHNRKKIDVLAKYTMGILAVLAGSLIVFIGLGLFLRSKPILETKGLAELIFSANWRPSEGNFGFAPFIAGTIWVTLVALALAVPSALSSAIYLSEYAPKKVNDAVKPVFDVLAGISPVIFGAFGVMVVVPFVKDYIMPFAGAVLGAVPLFHSQNFTGFNIFSAGIVLAMMIFPVIASVSGEVIQSIPQEAREASLALGATRWETTKSVVLKKASVGIVAAVILGLSRAFGETIAVLMVVGNVAKVPGSLFDAAYTLPALIANNYGEMMSIPLYDSALLLAALILLGSTVFFNIAAWAILLRIEKAYV